MRARLLLCSLAVPFACALGCASSKPAGQSDGAAADLSVASTDLASVWNPDLNHTCSTGDNECGPADYMHSCSVGICLATGCCCPVPQRCRSGGFPTCCSPGQHCVDPSTGSCSP